VNPRRIPTVTVDELPDDAAILDVREPDEWRAGHVEGSRHVPMNSVPTALQFDPALIAADRPVYVICAMGGRSGQVVAWLVHHGYDAVNIAGGMHAWQDSGRPMVTGDSAAEGGGGNARPPTVL
jgi:rhodanese-related sulfurtransferase